MSSTPFAEPLGLELKPSRALGGIVVTLHLLALAAVPALDWPPLARWGLAGAVLGHGTWVIHRGVLGWHRRAVRRLLWRTADGVLFRADGSAERVRLAGTPYLTRYLVILPLRLESGRRQYLPLPADAVDANALRRLKMRLVVGA